MTCFGPVVIDVVAYNQYGSRISDSVTVTVDNSMALTCDGPWSTSAGGTFGISGSLKDAKGNGIAGVIVYARIHGGIIGSDDTDSSGSYSIPSAQAPAVGGDFTVDLAATHEGQNVEISGIVTVLQVTATGHDVALVDFEISPQFVPPGSVVSLNAKLENRGQDDQFVDVVFEISDQDGDTDTYSPPNPYTVVEGSAQVPVSHVFHPSGAYGPWTGTIRAVPREGDDNPADNVKTGSFEYDTKKDYPQFILRDYSVAPGWSDIVAGHTIVFETTEGPKDDPSARFSIDNDNEWLKRNEGWESDDGRVLIKVISVTYNDSMQIYDATFEVWEASSIDFTAPTSQMSGLPGEQIGFLGFSSSTPRNLDIAAVIENGQTVAEEGWPTESWSSRSQAGGYYIYSEVKSIAAAGDYGIWLTFTLDGQYVGQKVQVFVLPAHDIIVSNLIPQEGTHFRPGDSVSVSVDVSASGGYTEKPSLVLEVTGPPGYSYGDSENFSVSGTQNAVFSPAWNTTSHSPADYVITVSASIGDEINTSNNSQSVTVTIDPPPSLEVSSNAGAMGNEQGTSVEIWATVLADDSPFTTAGVVAHIGWPDGSQTNPVMTYDFQDRRYECTFVASQVGTYSGTVSAAEAGYLSDSDTFPIINIFNAAPDTTITSLLPGEGEWVRQTTLDLRWIGSDTGTAVSSLEYAWQIDSIGWNWTQDTAARVESLAEGPHTFTVKSYDGDLEDPQPAERNFAVDFHAPVVTISTNSGNDVQTEASQIVLEGTATDAHPSSGLSEVYVGSPAANEGTVEEWRFTVDLKPGGNILKVYAVDTAGNLGSDTIIVTRPDQVAAPTFSPSETTFTEFVDVSITCGTAEATIWYTVDGTTPSSTEGTEYDGAIHLTETTRIKAIAYRDGMTDSDVATKTYTKDVIETWYVDDDGPGEPTEDGSATYPFDAIQEAIDAAGDGDTVIVADGTYTGTGNYNIDFSGKTIAVYSENGPTSCIVDCQGAGRGFILNSGEGSATLLSGFTIRNGEAPTVAWQTPSASDMNYAAGGAIFCDAFDGTISNCVLEANHANKYGGGLFCVNSTDLQIVGCVFAGNSSSDDSGGLAVHHSVTHVERCQFVGNSARYGAGAVTNGSQSVFKSCVFISNTASNVGGGMMIHESSDAIIGCDFLDNTASTGGGICVLSNSSPTVASSILWGNTASSGPQVAVYNTGASTINVAYCDVESGEAGVYVDSGNGNSYTWGSGNISDDPNLVDPDGSDDSAVAWADNDYSLQSGSPCINVGDPAYIADPNEMDMFGHLRVIGGRIDIGAYEYSDAGDSDTPQEATDVPADGDAVSGQLSSASDVDWYKVAITGPTEFTWMISSPVGGPRLRYMVYKDPDVYGGDSAYEEGVVFPDMVWSAPSDTPITVPSGAHTYYLYATGVSGYLGSGQYSVAVTTVAAQPLELVDPNCYIVPVEQRRGGRIAVHFQIYNPNLASRFAGLGCSIKPASSTEWTDDPANDETIVVPNGYSNYSRYFDIPVSATPGLYTVGWGLWDGDVGSGSLVDSLLEDILTVTDLPVFDSNSADFSDVPFLHAQPGKARTYQGQAGYAGSSYMQSYSEEVVFDVNCLRLDEEGSDYGKGSAAVWMARDVNGSAYVFKLVSEGNDVSIASSLSDVLACDQAALPMRFRLMTENWEEGTKITDLFDCVTEVVDPNATLPQFPGQEFVLVAWTTPDGLDVDYEYYHESRGMILDVWDDSGDVYGDGWVLDGFPGFTVGGAIYTDAVNPIASGLEGVAVMVTGDGGALFEATTAGTQGLWQIDDVPEGTYTVMPNMTDYTFEHMVSGQSDGQASIQIAVNETNETANQSIQFLGSRLWIMHDWNGDGIVSIVGDVPAFVNCVYFGNCPDWSQERLLAVGDCNGDGIVSIVGDVPCLVDCVYFGNCP